MLSKFFKSKAAPNTTESRSGTPLNDPIQKIGQEALAAAHDPDGKVLLYAEAEDGVVSADIFSQSGSGKVRFRFAPQSLKSLIYSYWETEAGAQRGWATMCMIIDAGRFKISFEYPDKLVPGETLHERRPRVVQMHFGDAAVDYSAPR